MTGGGGGYEEGWVPWDPYVTFPIAADGAFSVELPTEVVGFAAGIEYGNCDFAGQAFSGLIQVYGEPVEPPIADGLLLGTYIAFAGELQVVYWYSPIDQRVTCSSESAGNLTGGLREEWDLRLAAGWNQVLTLVGDEQAWFRTGPATNVIWREMEP